MSYKSGPKTPWYVKRLLVPVSPDQPKAIGIDEVYLGDGDSTRLIVAVMCNDMLTLRYRNDIGEKNRGAGVGLDEMPPQNFRYVFVGDEHFRAAKAVHEPTCRYETSINGDFYPTAAQIDATALLLNTLMVPGKDRAHVAGFRRPGYVRSQIICRLSRLSGGYVDPDTVACRLGADLNIPIVRGADEVAHSLRRRYPDVNNFFGHYPDQRVEFTPRDMFEINMTRHEQRKMTKWIETAFPTILPATAYS